MKKSIMIISLLLLLLISVQSNANETSVQEFAKLDERITDLELQSLREKVNLGLDLKVESAVLSDEAQISGSQATSHSGFVGTVLFRLNSNAKVNDRLNVFASAESLSFFNDNMFANSGNSENRDVQPQGQGLKITKAYFDWKFYQDWISLSAGRLPTTKGPPAHLKDGTSRQGTYPVTGFSIPLDGIALTSKLSNPLGLKDNLSLRLIYEPGGMVENSYPFRGVNLGDTNNPYRVTKNHQFFTGMIEFEQTNSNGLWNKMLAILQYGYYKFASPKAFEVSGVTGKTDYDLYRVYFNNDKMADVKILSPYLEFNKIFNTNFDFYSTLSLTTTESFAKARAVIITGSAAGNSIDIGSFLHPGKESGTRIIIGSRYELPNRSFIGLEYMKATEKTAPTAYYADSLLTPNYFDGHSYEGYFIKNFYNDNFTVKLTYTMLDINSDLSNGFYFQDVKEKVHVTNLTFNIKI